MKSPKILMLTALVCGGSLTTAGLAGAGDSAAGAETLPPPNSQVERDKGTEPPSEGLSDQQLLDIARSKADRHGLSVAEARQSILDSKEILDFKLANLEEPWFGSVWVTYSDGYQVHVSSDPTEQGEYRGHEPTERCARAQRPRNRRWSFRTGPRKGTGLDP